MDKFLGYFFNPIEFPPRPYKSGAPKKLLKAQEQSLLADIKEAIDKRIEHRIATARRFAVSCNQRHSLQLFVVVFNTIVSI